MFFLFEQIINKLLTIVFSAMREGEILKNVIESQSLTVVQICKKTGISRTTLYGLYEKEVIDDYYKERLKRVNIEIVQNVQNERTEDLLEQLRKSNEILTIEKEALKREMELYREIIAMYRDGSKKKVVSAIMQSNKVHNSKSSQNIEQIQTEKELEKILGTKPKN